MPTPITCPKPIPGMCGVYLQDRSICYTLNRNKNLNIFGVENNPLNDPLSQHMSKSSFVFPLSPALTGSTFRPMRAMTNYTTSYWRRSRRRVALQWNESHLVECLCVWTSVTVQDYSGLFPSLWRAARFARSLMRVSSLQSSSSLTTTVHTLPLSMRLNSCYRVLPLSSSAS